MEVYSAVLVSLHTSTSMQYYETNGNIQSMTGWKAQLAGGNQLANYKCEGGFELDKIETQYMQQWLEWDLNWGCWISSLSQTLLGNAV